MVKLTVSIVNYNGGQFLKECLESVEKISDEADIIPYVVDNASSDRSVETARKIFPKVNYILNEENLGFGKANNQVLKRASSEYLLILNPDTYLEKGVISKMIAFMEDNPDVGAASCQILLPNGKIDLTAHRGFPTPWASFLYLLGDDSLYHLSKMKTDAVHEVDSISGAFFLTKKSVLEKVGYFDEDYFMYAEDIDLCFRIKKAGYKIMYVPEVKILHHKGISTGLKRHTQKTTTADNTTRKKSVDNFYQTMKIFYKKHYQKSYPFFINWFVILGINLRWWIAKRRMVV